MLKNKVVLVCVTGGIAAYKSASLVSKLVKAGACVHVLMTENALNFINPITFESLSKNKCIYDTFDRNFTFDVEHVSLAKKADLVVIAPATANVIGKIASGIADDMLTTTIMAAKCPKIIFPAMNTNMYLNPIVQRNINFLRSLDDYEIPEPASGYLACGDVGIGKMLEPEIIFEYIKKAFYPKDLVNKKILITAGGTREALDPVRFITNNSSGKMGYSLAKIASYRGADVTLISANSTLEVPLGVNVVKVSNASEMAIKVKEVYSNMDIVIMAAAVSDYTPINYSNEKIKKSDDFINIKFKKTEDILAYLGENRLPNQYICGFAMETENLLENARDKMLRKNVDMIVANSLKTPGAGFQVDTNLVTIITKNKQVSLPLETKEEVAKQILTYIINIVEG